MRKSQDVAVTLPERDVGNALLNTLSREGRRLFLAQCTLVPLAIGDALSEAGKIQRFAYFPSSGMISLSAQISGHPYLEIALLGRESMLGASLALGGQTSELRACVLSAGWAWRIGVQPFRAALASSSALRALVYGAAVHSCTQFAHAVPCMRFHLLQERLALWLLQAQDRSGGVLLSFTHQQLANTLGVQRSAVTLAAGKLQRMGFIQYVRGEVHITSREGLEGAACECYARGWRV